MVRVFAAGDMNIDVLCRAKPAKPGTESHAEEFGISIGGNAANFAVSLARLGVRTTLVSAIGSDLFTGFLAGELKGSGVAADLVKSDGPNGLSMVLIDRSGERGIVSNKGASGQLNTLHLKAKILPYIKKGDIVYIGGYFHLRKMQKGLPDFLAAAKAKGAKVLLDTCFDEYGLWMKALKPVLGLIDVIFMDIAEMVMLTAEKDMRKAVKKIQFAGAKYIVLKMGKDGSAFFSGTRMEHRKAASTACIDSTGAGDAFNAGFVLGMLRGLNMPECLALGNFVAGVKVRHHGLVLPSRKDAGVVIKKLRRPGRSA